MLEILPSVHSSTCFGVVESALQRRVKLRAIFGGQLIIDDQDFYLRALRKCRGFVEHQSAIFDLQLPRVHAEMISLLCWIRTPA